MSRCRVIGYRLEPAALEEPDAEAATVASAVAELVREGLPEVEVEHVGSTAVAGLRGKRVVDLMLMYPPGGLEAARRRLDELGFQRQSFGRPFPEERPMRVACVEADGTVHRVHVHVLDATSPEVRALRTFRDRLRADPSLAARYEALKRDLIEAGKVWPPHYSEAKSQFIRDALS